MELVAAVVQRLFQTRRFIVGTIAAVAVGCAAGPRAFATDRIAQHPLLGKPSPDFVQRLFTGPARNFRLSERRGQVVVLGFWTSWCGSCRAYLERLGRIDATYSSAGLVVIGVSLDDDPARATELTNALGTKFRNAFDGDKTLGRRFAVDDVPLTLLIDRDGVVRHAHGELGAAGEATMIAELRRLLDE
jgi:cytochrome c biogenesis protein CcmG/thiol:disulfide interchange protein DsbE